MNIQEKKKLKKLIEQSDYIDNTEGIRQLKHSHLIQEDILKIKKMKTEKKEMIGKNDQQFIYLCKKECSFLFNKYPDIFNKMVKDELNLDMMIKNLEVLEKIENGEIDQTEGSVIMGKLFHKTFIEDKLRSETDLDLPSESFNKGLDISWKDYKQSSNDI